MTDETILAAALAKSDPGERATFLDDACRGDPERRRRVAARLAALDVPTTRNPDPDVTTHSVQADEAGGDEAGDALGFLSPPGRPDSLGRLGHYEVLEVLGRGGFGIVFRAFDQTLARVVAVKVLAPQVAATSPARKRFLREARSSAAVRHDNVVQVHAVEEHPLPYLVMEFVPGETLQQRLDRTGPLDVPEVLDLGRQIAEGLAAAHGQGLIHRDIKPANILIDGGPHPRAKITDFGLARAADDATLTRSGTVAGTPMYMAPEQARGESLDHRADLFSLGSVLYAVLTGRPPFHAEHTLVVLKRVADDTPRPIREVIPEVPEWLCRVVGKLHQKDPADRFQTAREVADLLADCEAQLKAHGELKDFSRVPGGRPAARPRRWKWAAAALVLLAPLGAWGVYAATQPVPRPELVEDGKTDPPVPPPPAAVAPFGAARAKELQEAWAAHLGVEPEVTNSVGMKLRLIPPGEFTMGSSAEEIKRLLATDEFKPDWAQPRVRAEGPARRVSIREPFLIGVHEVTVGQFREFVKAAGYKTEAEKNGGGFAWNNTARDFERSPGNVWSSPTFSGSENHPVVFIAPADARAFCDWLGEKNGCAYALPTEEQWEYACRAGTVTDWSFGEDPDRAKLYAWTLPHSGGNHHPVGQLAANPFGLFDMHGNVHELTATPEGVVFERGGDANGPALWIRSASRGGPILFQANDSNYRNGFRVVMLVTAKK